MQIYVVRYNPFLYHLGLKLNVKPFPIICALLCLERNKYGKERFIVGCLVFIKWYVWSLTKEFKLSSILQTQESVIAVAFSTSSWRFPQLAPFQGSTLEECCPCVWDWLSEQCCCCVWDRAARWTAGAHVSFVGSAGILTGFKPGRGKVYPLLVVLPTGAGCTGCGCLQVLQFHWESCCSCASDPALLGTQTAHGKSVKVLSVSVEECLGSLAPLQSAFVAPRTLECCLHVKRVRWTCPTNRARQSLVDRARDLQIGERGKKPSDPENVTNWHGRLLSQGRVKFLNLQKKNKGLIQLWIVFCYERKNKGGVYYRGHGAGSSGCLYPQSISASGKRKRVMWPGT